MGCEPDRKCVECAGNVPPKEPIYLDAEDREVAFHSSCYAARLQRKIDAGINSLNRGLYINNTRYPSGLIPHMAG